MIQPALRRQPASSPPRRRYTYGAQPVPQPVAEAQEGLSMPINRSRHLNRENSRLIRDFLLIEPETLNDVDWQDHVSFLVTFGLDYETIETRAGAYLFPHEKFSEAQIEAAGLDDPTTARRREWLDRINKPDPAIARRDEELALERRRRGLGSISEPLPTDAPAPAPQPIRAAPITAQHVQPVAPPTIEPTLVEHECAPQGEETAHDADLSPEEERCLDALRMVEQGMSRKDVAAHYGKASRTVFDWINRAQRIRRERLNGLLPADVLANAHARYEAKVTDLEHQYASAKAAGSTGLMIELSREMRRWERQHLETLRLTGFFRAYLHPAVPHSGREAAVQSIFGDF